MKHKIFASFFIFAAAAVLAAFFYTYRLYNLFESNKEELHSQNLVNANDMIKNAEAYLNGKNDQALEKSIEQYGFGLKLYDFNGNKLFDSDDKVKGKDKEVLSPGNISNEDINKILAGVTQGEKVFIVGSDETTGGLRAIAVIDINKGKPGAGELEGKTAALMRYLCGTYIILVAVVFLFIYIYVLRPFKKLENFAAEVARGNLEIPVVIRRHNLFGAFSWAFDMMRNELKSSKEKQAEAERTKKELVAVLSHDIRTPIASIKAYAECLKSLPEKNSLRSERYIDVIIKKTDEISKLSQDMFLHVLSDLEKLEFATGEFRSRELLNEIMEPLILQYESRIIVKYAFPDVLVFTDKARLAQVFENIISNTSKYSPGSDIMVEASMADGMLKCCFKDLGDGVEPGEIPFLFDKFYRGSNAKESGKPGSGLGLYISKYILEKTGGRISASNYREDDRSGFLVEVSLKIVG